MKKWIILLTSLLAINCTDEICESDTTPQLIVTFKDANNVTDSKSISLTASANNLDPIYENITTDSIALPLDPGNKSTTYHFTSNNQTEDVVINYNTKNVFISRSCGYKTIFTNTSTTNTNTFWLSSIILNTTNISDENKAHLTIYH